MLRCGFSSPARCVSLAPTHTRRHTDKHANGLSPVQTWFMETKQMVLFFSSVLDCCAHQLRCIINLQRDLCVLEYGWRTDRLADELRRTLRILCVAKQREK